MIRLLGLSAVLVLVGACTYDWPAPQERDASTRMPKDAQAFDAQNDGQTSSWEGRGDARSETAPDAATDGFRDAAPDAGCPTGACGRGCARACDVGEACDAPADCESGVCNEGICRVACARTGCALGEACAQQGDCGLGTRCSGGICRPECATSCAPGEACVSDQDCSGDDVCHPDDHVCLTACTGPEDSETGRPTIRVLTRADVRDLRYCHVVAADLYLVTDFSLGPDADNDLPYLAEVENNLRLEGEYLTHVTLSALERVDGEILAGANTAVEVLQFPSLVSVGSALRSRDGAAPVAMTLGLAPIRELRAPALRFIGGGLSIGLVDSLTLLDLRALENMEGELYLGSLQGLTNVQIGLPSRGAVSGSITLSDLPDAPWSAFRDFASLPRSGDTISNVGCNTSSPHSSCP